MESTLSCLTAPFPTPPPLDGCCAMLPALCTVADLGPCSLAFSAAAELREETARESLAAMLVVVVVVLSALQVTAAAAAAAAPAAAASRAASRAERPNAFGLRPCTANAPDRAYVGI
mmetsp:Transcript_11389/g.31062  ORF Transcript_11389/g.31062 Transcript_11389/m.31062 type:complete len:117 (+) Transcript_11389:407-757(+)